MFYSESLLSRSGALARVWLASNLDRKLTKQNVLTSNLETNVKDIIGGGQAPMALRLSGQLLLGVVKIYNRKAKYLMDDCNDALLKIKMAFRPGNVDLPSDQSHKANPLALMLPDTITELDLFAPLPDPEDLFRVPEMRAPGQDPTLLDFGMSQVMDSQTPTRRTENRLLQLEDDDLGLDIGLEPGETAVRSTPLSGDHSIEIGRRALSTRADDPSLLLQEDDLGLDLGFDIGDSTVRLTLDDNHDLRMGGVDDEVAQANAAALDRADHEAARRRPQGSESPLSSARSSVARDLETTFQLDPIAMEDEDPTVLQAAQRVKRRKVMPIDNETMLHNRDMKRLQDDRSAITKAPSYLPRDPLLLQLMEMQRNGSFVSNLMGDGRMQGWAPELRGILSLEVVRKVGDKKRKRDSGVVPDIEVDREQQDSPQLAVQDDVDDGIGADVDNIVMPAEDELPLEFEEEEEEPYDDPIHFDITEAPLLHPSQSGPVALGTKKMVHMLREHFAPEHPVSTQEPPTPSKRVKSSALFTDLCPPQRTTRNDATKMFFELLVLGTKDAIKVEQESGELNRPIRVRGKRGLWGDWAEMGQSGMSQEEQGAEEVAAEA